MLVSLGQGNRGAINGTEMLGFSGLISLFSTAKQDPMRHRDFMKLSSQARSKEKARDPFVAFAYFDGNRRNGESFEYSTALALDFDYGTPELFAALESEAIQTPFAFLWHTTRSHTRDHPRIRVIIPCGVDVSRIAHRRLVSIVSPLFLAELDPGSLEAERIMYRPVQNQGADFKWGAHHGSGYLNPACYLGHAEYEGYPRDKRLTARPVPACVDGELAVLTQSEPPLTGVTLEVARSILLDIDPDLSEPEWLQVLRGMHHQGSGLGELDLWLGAAIEWSARGEKYEEGVVEDKWDRLKPLPGRKPVTFATVIKMAKEARIERKNTRVVYWHGQIKATDDEAHLHDVLPRLIQRDGSLDSLARKKLVSALQARLKEVTGMAFPVAEVRALLTPATSQPADRAPAWVREHVYVTDDDVYFNKRTKARLSYRAFNVIHNRDMPKNESGNPVRQAADAAAEKWNLEVVRRIGYHPQMGDTFEVNGVPHVNRYDPASVPSMPDMLTEDQQAAVEVVAAHIANILPDRREQQLLTSWLAFVVQNPGIKIRWAPYLCGPEGDGKSFFLELLGLVIGSANVRSLSGHTLESSPFTDWAVGQCVTGIEEMKLHGHNRFDASNKLKPFITNESIDVHPKGKPTYQALNTTQYIVFSNYLDGVPITDTDRRYMFLRSRFGAASLQRFKAENPGWYPNLFKAIRAHPEAMRFWLMHFAEFHADFKPDGNAPLTAIRDMVIDMSRSEADAACQDVLREKAPGVTEAWIASTFFVTAIQAKLGANSQLGRQKLAAIASQFLADNGYVRMSNERHRLGPTREPSYFWRHESLCEPPSNWWEFAEPILAASFSHGATQQTLE
ncbi:Primase 2 [Burkholderia sp. MR1]|nr:Primase 2 [Burkholderia sp. MR1]